MEAAQEPGASADARPADPAPTVLKDVDVATVVSDAALDGEWDALARAVGAAPFLWPGWVRAWMSAFAPGRPLHVVTVRRSGVLVGLLPLLRGTWGATMPVNAETPSMEPIAVDELALEGVVEGLLAGTRRVDLRFLPVGERERTVLTTVGKHGRHFWCETLRDSPYTRVDGDWETYQREVIPASRRKSLRRSERLLAADGVVELDERDGQSELEALFTEGFELERAGWKGARGTAVLSRPPTASFYRAVAEWAAREGMLRLYFLRLDGRAIAFLFQLERDGVAYSLKIAYDEQFRSIGPGLVLKHRCVAALFARPEIRRLEWLGENEHHKQDFTTGTREQVLLQVLPAGLVGVLGRGSAMAVSQARAAARRRLSPDTRQRIVAVLGRIRG